MQHTVDSRTGVGFDHHVVHKLPDLWGGVHGGSGLGQEHSFRFWGNGV